jgi:hypothetical protein
MVSAGESMSPGQGRNNNGLEIGCVVDAASGLLTFIANGKELSTYYQVPVRPDGLRVLGIKPFLPTKGSASCKTKMKARK